MRPTIGIAAAAIALAAATPACAQGYTYVYVDTRPVMDIIDRSADQPERDCMSGRTPKKKPVDARAAAIATLQRYLHLAAGAAPADATAAFSFDAKRREWLHNGSAGTPRAVDDPLARALAARGFALGEPDTYRRSGDGFAALGIWRVAADSGTGPGGYYRALFRLEGMDWNIQRLEVVEDAEPGPAGAFCHFPGDLAMRAEVVVASNVSAREVADHKGAAREAAVGKGQRLTAVAGIK